MGDDNRVIGFTCGSYDLLHAGHILMLEKCKEHCDHLTVGLQSDPTIDRPDEKRKPVQTLFERYIQLAAVRFIDNVIPYDTEQDLINVLKSVSPRYRFLGSDYRDRVNFTGKNISNIEIIYLDRNHDFSTTELRRRCYQSG